MFIGNYQEMNFSKPLPKWIPVIVWVAFAFLLLVAAIESVSDPIEVNVLKTNLSFDVMQQFTHASIVSPGKIIIPGPSGRIGYLAPRSIDILYCLGFFVVSIISCFFYWDFSYKNPFTSKALWGLRVLLLVSIIFLTANFWRYAWFGDQVKALTNGQYHYNEKPNFLTSPEIWLLFILIRLVWLFKKGVNLQKENELTV